MKRLLEIFRNWSRGEGAKKASFASVHGMLNFASGFVLGGSLKPLCKVVSELMEGTPTRMTMMEVCDLAAVLIPAVQPRSINFSGNECRFLIYTDGAYENGHGTWGALIWDKRRTAPLMFWGAVPPDLLEFWVKHAGTQVICEIELFAHLLVRWALRFDLQDELGISFIDNDAARVLTHKVHQPVAVHEKHGLLLEHLGNCTPFWSLA